MKVYVVTTMDTDFDNNDTGITGVFPFTDKAQAKEKYQWSKKMLKKELLEIARENCGDLYIRGEHTAKTSSGKSWTFYVSCYEANVRLDIFDI